MRLPHVNPARLAAAGVLVALLTAGCAADESADAGSADASATQPAGTDAGTTSPAEASGAADGPLADIAYGLSGADQTGLLCEGIERDPRPLVELITVELQQPTQVVSVLCESYAYQAAYRLVGWDGSRAWLLDVEVPGDVDPATGELDLVRSPTAVGTLIPFEAQGRIAVYDRARGAGGCGTYTVYALTDTGAEVAEVRRRTCEDADSQGTTDADVDPSTWPIIWPPDRADA